MKITRIIDRQMDKQESWSHLYFGTLLKNTIKTMIYIKYPKLKKKVGTKLCLMEKNENFMNVQTY